MKSVPSDRLGGAIRWILLRRLGIAALVISLVVAFVAFLFARVDVQDEIVEIAVGSAAQFNAQIRPLLDSEDVLDRSKIQRELERFASVDVTHRRGRFVLVVVRDKEGRMVARLDEEGYEHGEDVEDRMGARAPSSVPKETEVTGAAWIDEIPHVFVLVPLFDGRGEAVASIEGAFALSSEALGDVRRRIWRVVGIAVAIVLVTTGVVYPIIGSLIGRLGRLTNSLLDANLDVLRVLGSAVAKRDSDTDIHNYRVTIISVRIAEQLDVSHADIQSLIKGAFLHDVGKIGIRDDILLKPGRLDEDEYRVMKTHVTHGLDIVKGSEWLDDSRDVVGYHHEKFDGTGYRTGLVGNDIPLGARIFAVADVFDALTSRRPYKEPLSFDEAMAILEEGRGTHFDPQVLDAFAGIASSIYDELANRDDERPRQELQDITEKYFKTDPRTLLT